MDNMSAGAVDLITRMLEPDPDERIALAQIRYHPWVLQDFNEPPCCALPNYPPIGHSIPDPDIIAQLCYLGFKPAVTIQKLQAEGPPCQEVAMYHKLKAQKQMLRQSRRASDTDWELRRMVMGPFPSLRLQASTSLQDLPPKNTKLCSFKRRSLQLSRRKRVSPRANKSASNQPTSMLSETSRKKTLGKDHARRQASRRRSVSLSSGIKKLSALSSKLNITRAHHQKPCSSKSVALRQQRCCHTYTGVRA